MADNKIVYAYKLILKVKHCSTKFHQGFEPGVLCTQIEEYTLTKEESNSPLFIAALIDREHEFLTENIEVIREAIESSNTNDKYDYCKKCNGRMKVSKAIQETVVVGAPDFCDDVGGQTMSAGGPGKLIDCLKCQDCGWSVTL